MAALLDLRKEQYISLETFRKNGQGVKTPVWVVSEGHKLYVWTQGDSWKVKRIHNNSQVRLAKSDARGNVSGDWLTAQARILDSPEEKKKMQQRLVKKYGLMARLFQLMGRLRGSSDGQVVVEIWAA
ncbi:PPOX class F420-dependent oxidoreductase [Candidatus Leptofilum sp.]|uniref:PPOX class F420-dependent oxidoreductase n=1 Tax=Candidatus Leptofilum sp. TaxID=3241576 RepID=UPI003B5B06D7